MTEEKPIVEIAYKTFLIVFFPVTLIDVTVVWFITRPEYTWLEMLKICWNAK